MALQIKVWHDGPGHIDPALYGLGFVVQMRKNRFQSNDIQLQWVEIADLGLSVRNKQKGEFYFPLALRNHDPTNPLIDSRYYVEIRSFDDAFQQYRDAFQIDFVFFAKRDATLASLAGLTKIFIYIGGSERVVDIGPIWFGSRGVFFPLAAKNSPASSWDEGLALTSVVSSLKTSVTYGLDAASYLAFAYTQKRDNNSKAVAEPLAEVKDPPSAEPKRGLSNSSSQAAPSVASSPAPAAAVQVARPGAGLPKKDAQNAQKSPQQSPPPDAPTSRPINAYLTEADVFGGSGLWGSDEGRQGSAGGYSEARAVDPNFLSGNQKGGEEAKLKFSEIQKSQIPHHYTPLNESTEKPSAESGGLKRYYFVAALIVFIIVGYIGYAQPWKKNNEPAVEGEVLKESEKSKNKPTPPSPINTEELCKVFPNSSGCKK